MRRERNARQLSAHVDFIACDLVEALRDRSIDVLVSNPPYVPRTDQPGLQREVRDYEPHVALFGGPTGLEIYERLIADAARVLRPGGWLLLELGYNSLRPGARDARSGWTDIDRHPRSRRLPARPRRSSAPMKRTLLWLIIALLLAITFLLYQRRSENHLNVTPNAERAIEKARQR